jgi:hypothetical protein
MGWGAHGNPVFRNLHGVTLLSDDEFALFQGFMCWALIRAITNDPKQVLKALGVGESMRKAG